MPTAPIAFVLPAERGRITGGNLVNAELIVALGARARVVVAGDLARDAASAPPTDYLIDTLCLEAAGALVPGGPHRRWLLAHLLPSQDAGQGAARREAERRTLPGLDGAIVFSRFMRDALVERGVSAPICEVAPGLPAWARPPLAPRSPSAPPRLLVVGNLTAIKGVVELLEGIARAVDPRDRFALRVVGDDGDPAVADRCRALAATKPLANRVTLAGPRRHAAMAAEYRAADLVVSAAVFESYGLALAEACAAGVPIAVLDAGHAAAHVRDGAGVVAADHADLVDAVLALIRQPTRLAELGRAAHAQATARPRPTWADAAGAIARHLGAAA